MDSESQIKSILKEDVLEKQEGVEKKDIDLLAKLITEFLLQLKPIDAAIIIAITTAMISSFLRRVIPSLDTSENDYWTRKIIEILSRPKQQQ